MKKRILRILLILCNPNVRRTDACVGGRRNVAIRQNPYRKDDHARCRAFGYHPFGEGKGPGKRGHPSGAAAFDFRRQAA